MFLNFVFSINEQIYHRIEWIGGKSDNLV